MVSTGDYVTRGMKVAQVVRITPLRIELTVPEQFVASVNVGQPVSFSKSTLFPAGRSTARCASSRPPSARISAR